MSKRAVLVIDLQNEYFPGGKLELRGIEEASRRAARVVAETRRKGDRVVHIRHESADGRRPFFVPGTKGVETHVSVAPVGDEPVVVKHFPNSFRETGLKERLDEWGIEAVTLVGAMSHMCIDATARAACDLGYAVTVLHDACATLDLAFDGVVVSAAQVHATIMAALAFAYGEVMEAEAYLIAAETNST